MAYEISVLFKGDYVEVISNGDKSYESAVRLWDEVTKACTTYDCYKVLGIANSSQSMPIMASVNHKNIFEEFHVTRKYKIAWVELNKEAVDNVRFLENYLLNRGLINGKLFENVERARKWLIDN